MLAEAGRVELPRRFHTRRFSRPVPSPIGLCFHYFTKYFMIIAGEAIPMIFRQSHKEMAMSNSNIYICIQCNAGFITKWQKANHVKWDHSDSRSNSYLIYCSCVICKKEITTQSLSQHIQKHEKENTPKSYCLQCNSPIFKDNKFCGSSCSATFNNKRRKHTDETKEKIRITALTRPKIATTKKT